MTLNLLLEIFNGSFGILAVVMTFLLGLHIVDMMVNGGPPPGERWRRGWHRTIPVGLQIAIGCFLIGLSEAVTRPVIWGWRALTAADPDALWVVGPSMVLGAIIGCWGFLWVVRGVTRARYGVDWPWMVSLGVVLAFILWTVVVRVVLHQSTGLL